MSADTILRYAASLFEERHNVYGDNYLLVGRVMAALFPEGLTVTTVDDWNRLHIFLLQVVKQTRYVENWQKGGHEDSSLDLSVYAAMLADIDKNIAARDIPF